MTASSADIVAVIGEHVRLVRRGRSFTGLCPFHDEKGPSFHVNEERGFFYCFECKASGGVVEFAVRMEQIKIAKGGAS